MLSSALKRSRNLETWEDMTRMLGGRPHCASSACPVSSRVGRGAKLMGKGITAPPRTVDHAAEPLYPYGPLAYLCSALFLACGTNSNRTTSRAKNSARSCKVMRYNGPPDNRCELHRRRQALWRLPYDRMGMTDGWLSFKSVRLTLPKGSWQCNQCQH